MIRSETSPKWTNKYILTNELTHWMLSVVLLWWHHVATVTMVRGKRLMVTVPESPATDAQSQNRVIVCFVTAEDQKIRISLWFITIFFALHFWGESGKWGGKLQAPSLRENTTKEGSGLRFEPRTCYWGLLGSHPSLVVPLVLIMGLVQEIKFPLPATSSCIPLWSGIFSVGWSVIR